jgi:uncharacterized alpha-E superfamily protein
MLSRVADSIFWMTRYIERAENVARFIDVNMQLAMDVGSDSTTPADQWAPLVITTGDYELFTELYGQPDQQKALEFLTFDTRNPNSIITCLSHARENARTVREMISSSMWEELNKFYLMVRAAKGKVDLADAGYEFFKQVKLASHLLEGITVATMSHGEAWHFARMGRLLERADKTSRILDVKYYVLLPSAADVGTPLDTVQWSALLESASALEMYRKRFGRITPVNVADFLILDSEFPRAIHFCLIKTEDSLLSITGGQHGRFRSQAEKRLGRVRAELDYTQIGEIIEQGLHEFIDEFQIQLNQVGDAIYETFFALRPVNGSVTVGQQQS